MGGVLCGGDCGWCRRNALTSRLGECVLCGVCGMCMRCGICVGCVGACGMCRSVWGGGVFAGVEAM